MEERIKELRKSLGLTQKKFADAIGVKQNTVAQYEIGRNPPTDTVITLICREFGVNEIWLREGIGDMFREKTVSEEIGAFFGNIQASNPDFKKAFITILARMKPEEWRMVEEKARELVEEMKKTDPQ